MKKSKYCGHAIALALQAYVWRKLFDVFVFLACFADDSVRKNSGIDQISGINLQSISNVEKDFQRKRTDNTGRFDCADTGSADICFLSQLILRHAAQFA